MKKFEIGFDFKKYSYALLITFTAGSMLLMMPSLGHAQSADAQIGSAPQVGTGSPNAPGFFGFLAVMQAIGSSSGGDSSQQPAPSAPPPYNFENNVCRIYDSQGFIGQAYYDAETRDRQLKVEDRYGADTSTPKPQSKINAVTLASAITNKVRGIEFEGDTCAEIYDNPDDKAAMNAAISTMYLRQQYFLSLTSKPDKNLAAKDASILGAKVSDSIQKGETSIGSGGALLEPASSSGSAQ